MPERVVISLIGSVLDAGEGPYRWERWRPNVALCQHEDLLIHRFELLHGRKYTKLANALVSDMRCVAPETDIRLHLVELQDPWDFEEVYAALHDFARAYAFDPDREE